MIWNDQTILVFPHFFCLPDSLFWKVPFSKSNLKVKYPCEFWNVWYWKLKITFRSFKWGITHFCTLAMNRAGACFPNCVWKKSSFFARDCRCRAGGTRVTGVARATPIIERFTMNYYYVPHQYLRDLLLCATPIFKSFRRPCVNSATSSVAP